MKCVLALIFVVALMATAGCANMTPRQQRALSGGPLARPVGRHWGRSGRQSCPRGRHWWGRWGGDGGADQIAPDD
jgi:hypothetical protein